VPGTGIYYTKTAGGHRRVRRSAAPLRLSYSGPATTTSYKGCLYAIGVIVLLVLAIVTYGLILIPVAIGVGVWIWYRRRQPASIAGRITKQALAAPPPVSVHLLNQAIEVDPQGPMTLRTCASWFYDHQCWQDAAEAYAGLLHTQSEWESERRYVTCLLAANRPDEAIPRLEHLRSASPADDFVQAALLGQLATAYLLKGELGQAGAFIDLAPLQKRNLDAALQGCLYLRSTVRYLSGDRRRAIADLERLYAVNPAMPGVSDSKAAMQAGAFKLSEPNPYPGWYPAELRESASSLAAQPTVGGVVATSSMAEDDQEATQPNPLLATAIESRIPMASTQAPELADAESTAVDPHVEPENEGSQAQPAPPDPYVSPDGVWRWDGTRWIPNVRSE
jgi:tetratricopeptide (TPR) repeat protein